MRNYFKTILSCGLFHPLLILALPQNPTVQNGGATFTGTGANSNELGVSVTSPVTVIDWTSFSIGEGEAVTFSQNGSTSNFHVWNKVTGSSISQIDGAIIGNSSANVYLFNSNGIVVGPTGTILTNSFVASSLDLVDTFDPTATMEFKGSSSSGTVTINGAINALGGDITIIGYRIVNTGTLTAGGTISQAAGTDVLLQPSSNQRVFINAGGNAGAGIGIDFSGTANGESVVLVADGNAYTYAINQSGVINCTACSTSNGQVYLLADPLSSNNGAVTMTGSIVRNSTAGQAPPVTIIGKTISLINGASIAVNGANGGGVITIGDQSTYDTDNIYIDGTTSIFANANSSGNGGSVTMWASDSIIELGNITSLGSGSGNGGNVSLTTPGYLGYNAIANLSGGTSGSDGTLTLTTTAINVGGIANYNGYYVPPSFTPGNITSRVPTTSLQNTLAYANVSIIANGTGFTGDMLLADNINWSSGNQLSLQASNKLQMNYLLTMTGASSNGSNVVSLTAPTINIGLTAGTQTNSNGVNLTSGGITTAASSVLNLQGGSGSNASALLSTGSGTNTITFGEYMNVIGGSALGANAQVQGTTVNVNGITSGTGTLLVQAEDCTSAFLQASKVNIGQNTEFNNIQMLGGCCSSGNNAYIGSLTGSSTINIDLAGGLYMIGGSSGSSNQALIISSGGINIPVNVNANTISINGGTGGSGNTANISSLGNLGSVTLTTGQDLMLTGGSSAAMAAAAYVEASNMTFTVGRDVSFNGGAGVLNRVYFYGYNGVTGTVARNLTLNGGSATLASAEIKGSSGTISLNSSSNASTFAFNGGASGTSNAGARIYMVGNGNISIGATSAPEYIEFKGGSGGVDVYALALVEGNGNIYMNAQQDISLQGGGSGTYTQAGVQTLGSGSITLVTGRDLLMTTGTSASSNVYFDTAQGAVIATVGRDCTMVGICDLNEAYITSLSSNGGLLINVARNLSLSGWATINTPNPSNSYTVSYGGTKTVIDCSSINGGGAHGLFTYPGNNYFNYPFLYELFYRLRYFTNYDWYLLHIDDFWDTMMRVSP